MEKLIFEVERDGSNVIIWIGGLGSRVSYPNERLAILQEDTLLFDERRFREAKESTGVATIEKFGEHLGPLQYLERLFKSYRSGVGRLLGIEVFENTLKRPNSDWW